MEGNEVREISYQLSFSSETTINVSMKMKPSMNISKNY